MKGHGAKFSRKQEEAIAALLTHRNIDEAAKAIGVTKAYRKSGSSFRKRSGLQATAPTLLLRGTPRSGGE
jgi:hypothetical protein